MIRTILVAFCLVFVGCSARQEASKPQPVRPEANIVDNPAMIGYFPPLYAGKSYAVSEGSTNQMGALHLLMARQNHVIEQDASDIVYAATTCVVQKGDHCSSKYVTGSSGFAGSA